MAPTQYYTSMDSPKSKLDNLRVILPYNYISKLIDMPFLLLKDLRS